MQIFGAIVRNKSRNSPHFRTNRESGQALIEFALCMPILLSILLGAVEFGRMEYASIEVTDAAMAGVQYGAQSVRTAVDTTGIQTVASNAAPDITMQTPTVSTSCICSDGSASTCLSTDCSTSAIEKILTVQTQAQFTSVIKIPGVPNTFTLNGQAVQKVLE